MRQKKVTVPSTTNYRWLYFLHLHGLERDEETKTIGVDSGSESGLLHLQSIKGQ
jgi:hypothetical protein